MSDLEKINSSFEEKINSIKSKDELQSLKTEFFGKSGQITVQFKSIGNLKADKKKEFASDLKTIYQAPDEKKALIALEKLTEKLNPKYQK